MTILGGDAGEAAADVLARHSVTLGECACGWRRAGSGVSSAQHVLHELQMAGLDVVWR